VCSGTEAENLMKAKAAKKRANPSSCQDKAAARRRAFAEEYLSNGGNALQAAISVGFSQKTAGSQGSRLLKHVEVLSIIDSRRSELRTKLEISTERVLKEISRIAFSDPRRIMRPDGTLMMPHVLDDDTAAASASFEFDPDGKVKYKFWDKNSAHERVCKILGEFEKDNKQKVDIPTLTDAQRASRLAALLDKAKKAASGND
jgi:phage terminase small subunit